jgi:acetolactate synthase-1/2/3 large subunit
LIKSRLPRISQIGEKSVGFVHSVDAINRINESLDRNAVVVTDVGAALLSGHYILEKYGSQRIFTSQGLGEMGFGLPGAVGAYFADPARQLVCLNTDGAIMFNLQELQVVNEHKIPIKLFIFNNAGYSMIKISQTNLFDSRLSGSSTETGLSFPDFELIAKTFRMKYSKITSQYQLDLRIDEILASDESVLIEVVMSPNQRYLPRLSTIKLPDSSLMSPPLEDLEPLIDLEELAELLGYEPNPSSYKIRGLTP